MPAVLVVTGPSGAGKGTLIRELVERVPAIEVTVSATTRERRRGEEDGREYWFLSDADFSEGVARGKFLEYVEYVSGHRYGTLRSELDRIAANGHVPLLELETEGALRVKQLVPGAVTIFISARVDELERRLRERDDRELGRDPRADRARSEAARAGRRVRPRDRERRPRACGRRADDARPRPVGSRSYHAAAMIEPRVDDLLENVDSRYALVIVAAKRARQINNYHHQLGEGTFGDNLPPLVESRSKNYLTMALEEVSDGMLKYDYAEVAARHHCGHVPRPPGGDRRHRRLQGVRAVPAARQGGPRRRSARHARAPSASSRPRRSARSRGGPPATTSTSTSRAPTCSSSRRARRTRWPSSRTGSPTTSSPRRRSRTAGRCSSRRR